VDAKCPRALVGRAVTGNGNIHALVRAAFIPEIDLHYVIQRREIEDRADLLALRVSRPRGSFTLHRDIIRPAVFLAGGIGIAPIRSILQQASQERLPHKMYLFYSNREADDAAFIVEFEKLTAQNPNFTFIPTITGHRTIAWPYEEGHINREMLTRYLLGVKGPIYYIAGPSGMVSAMTELLTSLGVWDDDMKTEEFGEYKLNQDPAQGDPRTGTNPSNVAR
jgi:ferredoxin-NADP reductase